MLMSNKLLRGLIITSAAKHPSLGIRMQLHSRAGIDCIPHHRIEVTICTERVFRTAFWKLGGTLVVYRPYECPLSDGHTKLQRSLLLL